MALADTPAQAAAQEFELRDQLRALLVERAELVRDADDPYALSALLTVNSRIFNLERKLADAPTEEEQ
jgi:hypothetical protein